MPVKSHDNVPCYSMMPVFKLHNKKSQKTVCRSPEQHSVTRANMVMIFNTGLE